MSDTRSQLEEIDALISAAPNDPALQQLREDLLQLIALEEQEGQTAEHQPAEEDAAAADSYPLGAAETDYNQQSKQHAESAAALATSEPTGQHNISSEYAAKGTFMEHNIASKEDVAEAPDLGSFHPVYSNATKSQPSSMKGYDANNNNNNNNAESSGNLKDDTTTNTTATATTQQPQEKKKKKKKKKDDAVLDAKFELPSHLVPLESDTPAQKIKKQRTAKALKSKFREKQKEAQHAKKQNDWKSFATKTGKRKKGGGLGGSSIFSTEEGVAARVGVVSGGGRRTMTGFQDPNKRHKFT